MFRKQYADESSIEDLTKDHFKIDKDDIYDGLIVAARFLIGVLAKVEANNEKYFQKAVNLIVQYYDKNSLVIDCLGGALGILSLVDSYYDLKDARDIQKQVYSAFNAYYRKDISDKYLKIRLSEIRRDAEKLRRYQITKAAVKFAVGIGFGIIGFKSDLSMVQSATFAATAGMFTVAAAMDGASYYNLNELITRLKDDGFMN